jgi:hypothetical protein
MNDLSADEVVERLQQSLHKILGWAEAYQPRMLGERLTYDEDLDEAEDLLDLVRVWTQLHAGAPRQT